MRRNGEKNDEEELPDIPRGGDFMAKPVMASYSPARDEVFMGSSPESNCSQYCRMSTGG